MLGEFLIGQRVSFGIKSSRKDFRNGDKTNDPTPQDMKGAWPYNIPDKLANSSLDF